MCIKTGRPDFDGPIWNLISAEARDLIEHLIVVDPDKRYAPCKALLHKWLIGGDRLHPETLEDDPSSRSLIQENLSRNKRRLTKTLAPAHGSSRPSFNRAMRLSTSLASVDHAKLVYALQQELAEHEPKVIPPKEKIDECDELAD